MSSNSESIIHDIRAAIESVIEYVSNSEGQQPTAEAIERGLFQQLLGIGVQLLELFFHNQDRAFADKSSLETDGVIRRRHGQRQRSYVSLFGKLVFSRSYFYAPNSGGLCPLDKVLSLPKGCYSDPLRELMEQLGVHMAYNKVVDVIDNLLKTRLSTRVIQQAIGQDAQEVSSFYQHQPAPCSESEAQILVLQADGKGIPLMRETKKPTKPRLGKGEKPVSKKEAIVTAVYTIAPTPRTPQSVVESLFRTEDEYRVQTPSRSRPQHKQLWATLTGKDAALCQLQHSVESRDGNHITDRVALTDGCEALQKRVQTRFPAFCLVLDFIHALQYLWKVGNSLLGETHPNRDEQVASWALQLLSGQTKQLIDCFTQLAVAEKTTRTQRKVLQQVIGYFQRNESFMRYDEYLRLGWPIASGVIEGAARHLVKDRFELSGMRWSQQGAESLLHLRCVSENGDWHAYHLFRRQKRQHRLYGSSSACSQSPDEQCLPLAA